MYIICVLRTYDGINLIEATHMNNCLEPIRHPLKCKILKLSTFGIIQSQSSAFILQQNLPTLQNTKNPHSSFFYEKFGDNRGMTHFLFNCFWGIASNNKFLNPRFLNTIIFHNPNLHFPIAKIECCRETTSHRSQMVIRPPQAKNIWLRNLPELLVCKVERDDVPPGSVPWTTSHPMKFPLD